MYGVLLWKESSNGERSRLFWIMESFTVLIQRVHNQSYMLWIFPENVICGQRKCIVIVLTQILL